MGQLGIRETSFPHHCHCCCSNRPDRVWMLIRHRPFEHGVLLRAILLELLGLLLLRGLPSLVRLMRQDLDLLNLGVNLLGSFWITSRQCR